MTKKQSSANFDKAYKNLNKEQKKAVDTIEGPVMVIAGPGTGKTTILTLRIANILLKTDMMPENILALTFTNSGVMAMRKKLLDYIGDRAYRVNIFTFHSFAENIIREFSFYFKELEYSKIITDFQKFKILEEIMKENDFPDLQSPNDPFSSLKQIAGALNDLKQEGLSPKDLLSRIPLWEKEMLSSDDLYYKKNTGDYKKGDLKPSEKDKIDTKIKKVKQIANFFQIYQDKLKEQNLYDFNDMILSVLLQLQKNKNLRLDLQEKYQYILVDEHQDTNEGQNKIIEFLTDAKHLNKRPNLFTVGDEKQSIYRFQGASLKTFKHFNKIYNDIIYINLLENYRSGQKILDSAHSLIAHTIPESFKLNSNLTKDQLVKIYQFSNYKFEMLFLAQDISQKIKSGIAPEQIAIIYRSNKEIEDLKELFVKHKVPYTILSKENLLNDKNISNLINLLKLIENPISNEYLSRSLFIDFLKFDPYVVTKILKEFDVYNRNGKEFLSEFILKNDKLKEFDNFFEKIKDLKVKSKNLNFAEFFKLFLQETGYLSFMLKSNNGQEQILKIDKIFDEIKRQIDSNKNYSLTDFIKFVDYYLKYNLDIKSDDPEIVGGVNLLTAHKSKGLEFEFVYIINSTRSNWEKSRGFSKISLPISSFKGDIDDERRLFYVAMTRAKKELNISFSVTDWQGKEKEKSQFVDEIDDDCVEKINTKDFENKNLKEVSNFITHFENKNKILDKDYVTNLFLESNLSVTALNNYLECPNKYLFRSLIKIPEDYQPHSVFGNLIHNSLKSFFVECFKSQKILPKTKLLNFFNQNIINSSLIGKDFKKYKERGVSVLDQYYDNHHKTFYFNVLTEQRITKNLILDSGKTIILSGILDKIEFIDSLGSGKINIVDYKTGKTFKEKTDKQEKENLKRQLVFYALLLENYKDNNFSINQMYLDFVQKNKKNDFERFYVNVEEKDKLDLKMQINKMAKEIFSGDILKLGCNKKDCQYCNLIKNL
ncbi:MAG TPA: ATP-dependent DNA helicase [Candidatus Paceibacterota bacterium]|nr:ATP-dependent DNA helicase [Candidatus Paceibacterota bacterium]HMP18794.1 ATP-dependent DNA helicase [Candidatus Paceibacterota bacterium]